MQNSSKVGAARPKFVVCEYVVAIERRWCGWFRDTKSIICDHD